MKKKMFPSAFAGLLAVLLLAGCGQAAPGSQSGGAGTSEATAAPSAAPVEMERVPVVDEQYADIFDGFEVVGSFHDGVAFAAKYLPYSPEYFFPEYYPLECGYLTLDGQFTPLYQVPNEWELLDATRFGHGAHSTGGEMFILGTTEGMSMTSGYHYQVDSAPRMDEQVMMDDAFRVGDNGWVPYFENDKWGYCDLTGAVKLAPAYDFVLPFIGGKALVCTYDDAYRWMLIDETGAQLLAFEEGPGYSEWEKNDFFAQRKAGGEYILIYGKGTGGLYRQDGTEVAVEYFVNKFEENGGYALFYNSVYDPQGTKLYTAEDLVRAGGVQDGCTVYTDGTLYGIRGADGQVRCEARFSEICRLVPEGFYARENTNQVNLYDYDGNLMEETPACLRIVQSEDGFALYDGKGNILKQYSAAVDQRPEYSMNGSTFFTEEGFVYLRLSDGELLTLHITFEEQPVEAGGAAENFPPEDLSLAWQTGQTVSFMRTSAEFHEGKGITSQAFDALSSADRCLVDIKGGLEWYETLDGKIEVRDDEMNTVFTVSRETVERNDSFLGTPLRYLGDGLWKLELNGGLGDNFVFDREGTLLWQGQGGSTLVNSEGFFSAKNEFYSASTGEVLQIAGKGEQAPLYAPNGAFDGGLANTDWGYVNTRGEMVLDGEQLRQAVAEYLGLPAEEFLLNAGPFNGETAELGAACNDDTYYQVTIDRQGQVLASERFDDVVASDTAARQKNNERWTQLMEQLSGAGLRAFAVSKSPSGTDNRLTTYSGRTVEPPEGSKFGEGLVQWDDNFAFVQVDQHTPNNRYILVDALGDTYPDCAWEAVYVSPDGAAWGMNRFFNEDTGALERCEMTRLKITVS